MFMPKSIVRILAGLCVASLAPIDAASAASLQEAAELLSASRLETLEFSGAGNWFYFGQAPVPGGDYEKYDMPSYSAAIDFAKPGARVRMIRSQAEDGRPRPAPFEETHEWYLLGDAAWNVAPAHDAGPGDPSELTPAPHAVSFRLTEIWTTPQGFLKAALANGAASETAGADVRVSFTIRNQRYVGLIGPDNHVSSIRTWIDTPVLGDTLLETTFSDYKDFGGLLFPTRIHRSEAGHDLLHLDVASARANGTVDIVLPESVARAQPPTFEVVSETIADGVYYLSGGLHHSVAVEEKDHVVLIEAPLNEKRSLALIERVAQLAPGKPIRYVINSHAHFDHSGGLRTFVDLGAIIVTQPISKAFYETAWMQPRTLRPDRLSVSKKTPRFEAYERQHVLGKGDHEIQTHHIVGNGHCDDLALVYLPKEKLLIEADAYTPAPPGAPAPRTPNPYTVNLYENILRLGLDVKRIVGLHGRVVSIDELRTASGVKTAAQ
jgi:glyoxylase-like metal-dependent hydrolase (beta-lactamase superfamily II)